MSNIEEKTAIKIREAKEVGQKLLWEIEVNVRTLEKEVVYIGEVFNSILDKTKEIDKKLSQLISIINEQKNHNAKVLLNTIKNEIDTITSQLNVYNVSEKDLPIIKQNLDVLFQNKRYLENKILELKELKTNTTELEKYLEVLNKGIAQYERLLNNVSQPEVQTQKTTPALSFQERKLKQQELLNSIKQEINSITSQLKDILTTSDPNDLTVIKQNLEVLKENREYYCEEINQLKELKVDTKELEKYLEMLDKGIMQYEKAINSNIFLRLTNLIFEQINTIQQQINDAQMLENPEELSILKDNLKILDENIWLIRKELSQAQISNPNVNFASINEHFETLKITFEQLKIIIQELELKFGVTQKI